MDSVRAIADTARLRQLAAGARGGDIETRLLGGFAGMQLFRLTRDASAAKLARRSFEAAADAEPGDARAWFGVGLTWAEGPETTRGTPTIVTVRAFAEALGIDPASRAVRSFRRALEIDPLFVPAATALVPVAIEKRDSSALRLAHRALAAAELEGRFDLAALAALAGAADALGLHDAAVDAARRVVIMGGGQPADRYALAGALFGAGRDEEGSEAWFAALDVIDSATADRYHEDLRSLTDDWDEERWAHADLAGRTAWLRDFWTLRAALGGVTVARRTGDHYRRLTHALAFYPRHRKWGAPPTNALLLERPDLPFDDRGMVYVRHGEPYDVVRGPSRGPSIDSESWIYRSPEGGFTALHFFRYGSAVRSPGVAGNPEASAADGELGDAWNDWILVYNLPCSDEWHWDVQRYDHRLALLRCNEFDRRSISAEIRRDARLALRTDSDRPDFSREMPFVFDVAAFRGRDRKTDITAAVVLPPGSIEPASALGGVAYDASISLVIVDTMFSRVARADTVIRTVLTSPLGGAGSLRMHVTLPVEPGNGQALRITVREAAEPGHGQLYGRTIDVPAFDHPDLELSDIVLAEPDSGGTFARGAVALSLVPSAEFAGGEFRAFYEVYGAAPDARLTTEIVVDRTRRGIGAALRGLFGGGPIVRLRFETVAAPVNDVVQEVRRVETSLDPGNYRIRVRVTDTATGKTAVRERLFTVVSPTAGTAR